MIRYVTKYLGSDDPLSLKEYVEKGGFLGFRNAIIKEAPEVIEIVKQSGLTGRGGAYFPSGQKWEMTARQTAPEKYVVCNADEGEPGTFKDRRLLFESPFQVLEGLLIAAYAVGAKKGFVYIRGEYSPAVSMMRSAVDILKNAEFAPDFIREFDITVLEGAGAYICGEETALLESIEGGRGIPRLKPPFPGVSGLWGCPTLIHNVETLCNIPLLFELGLEEYLKNGVQGCRGTKLISLSGAVKKPGVYEVPFGTPLKEVLFGLGGGPSEEGGIKFVQIGGLTGKCVPFEQIDGVSLDLESMWARKLVLGSGAVYAAGGSVDVKEYVAAAMHFFNHESCGRCAPCRVGCRHLARLARQMAETGVTDKTLEDVNSICEAMSAASACGLGQTAPTVLESLMTVFPQEFAALAKE